MKQKQADRRLESVFCAGLGAVFMVGGYMAAWLRDETEVWGDGLRWHALFWLGFGLAACGVLLWVTQPRTK